MTQVQRLQPQLCMVRPDLQNLEPLQLPAGYSLRSFQAGDELAWESIIAASFERQDNPDKFETRVRADPAYRPGRVLFIVCEGEPVATASAWHMPKYGPQTGCIHMVGVRPDHQGKRLGYLASLAALYQFAAEGRTRALLETDDYRLPAIKTYLNLGFEPLLVHENQRDRWRNILSALGVQEKGAI